MVVTPPRIFFVSYTAADEAWATWIAETIESVDGWSVRIQAWDFVASKNFAVEMQEAVRDADHTVAVMSPAYFASVFGQVEWLAAWSHDPGGKAAAVIPILVEGERPRGLGRTVVSIDLRDFSADDAARTHLQSELRAAIAGTRPRLSEGFPGTKSPKGEDPSGPSPASVSDTVGMSFETRNRLLHHWLPALQRVRDDREGLRLALYVAAVAPLVVGIGLVTVLVVGATWSGVPLSPSVLTPSGLMAITPLAWRGLHRMQACNDALALIELAILTGDEGTLLRAAEHLSCVGSLPQIPD